MDAKSELLGISNEALASIFEPLEENHRISLGIFDAICYHKPDMLARSYEPTRGRFYAGRNDLEDTVYP